MDVVVAVNAGAYGALHSVGGLRCRNMCSPPSVNRYPAWANQPGPLFTAAPQQTPYADLNAVLHASTRVQNNLGGNFVGANLQGSSRVGDFDIHSDVDFLIAIENDISDHELPTLKKIPDREIRRKRCRSPATSTGDPVTMYHRNRADRTMSNRVSGRKRHIVSRRGALASLTAVACGYIVRPIPGGAAAENGAGPVFSSTGPNAERYGAAEGYPIADPTLARQPGEPHDPKYRVGSYSHFDDIFPTRLIKRAVSPWMFKRSQADIRYWYWGNRSSVTDYLSRNSDRRGRGDGRATPPQSVTHGPRSLATCGDGLRRSWRCRTT